MNNNSNLNSQTSSLRTHISFFGMTNAGKSSVVNAITNQGLSIVSDVKGTTTDPVRKAMEILPLGPVVIIDTPGLNDSSKLGELRIKKTKEILRETDIAVLVIDSTVGKSKEDEEIISLFKEMNLPFIEVYNKSDINLDFTPTNSNSGNTKICVSAKTKYNIDELKELLGHLIKDTSKENPLIGDLIHPKDIVILVIPIDESAPKGRLILPQQLVLRDCLDHNAIPICCQPSELDSILKTLNYNVKLVITDSQAFKEVSKIVPTSCLLTSFSILMARYKGLLKQQILGAKALKNLTDFDTVLIAEGCTHHRQCNDIGSVKMPNWIKNFSNSTPNFIFSSGRDFPERTTEFKVIVHCGGCMLTQKDMENRVKIATKNGTPIVNYGIAIAYMNGILDRSLEIFPDLHSLL
ncbi:[FeFe] hydrogenase H-cluster maturation GTPase HydF [Lachnospiraceae bacterium C7]|nr:[FeFe] hydrogenase H-cluster maturation GTPase HydF [Lachnospiraceae bacterium C7]